MDVTIREFWGVIHGLIFGGSFLLAFSGGLISLYSLKPGFLTAEGLQDRMARMKTWVIGMAVIVWATVITGAWIAYPWYRAKPPEGTDVLTNFPRSFLLSNESTALWHQFGMEWKEHVAWIAPIAATVVAYVIVTYGPQLVKEPKIRKALINFFTTAFVVAVIAGVFGAFITKFAPVR